jgi:hypothetical protein
MYSVVCNLLYVCRAFASPVGCFEFLTGTARVREALKLVLADCGET